MRLIETTTLVMETHIGRRKPPYAILSHTWEDEEVTLQDWNGPTRDSMKGFQKIRMTCQLAASDGIKYAWVDTCCIDKSNSAELSEAINSMYRWYQKAEVCYAYLSDLHLPASIPEDTEVSVSLLRGCRWFSRGWTLQELIAPADVLFYQHDWCHVGSKIEWCEALSEVVGIDSEALGGYDPKRYSIAERMSWAAGRETTREEDKAYCLLGIFDINMPMLYGEGEKAFRRLQEEIIRTGYDVSIFAWTRPVPGNLRSWRQGNLRCGAFANVPGDFYSMPVMDLVESQGNEISITNVGVKLTLELCLVWIAQTGKLSYVLPIRRRRRTEKGQFESALGVALEKWSAGRFARTNIDQLVVIPDDEQAGTVHRIRCPGAYVMTEIPRTGPKTGYPFNFVFHQGCRVVKGVAVRQMGRREKLIRDEF
ncbi:Vegetative incompatibility protein HET-E-1 [Colletotrichum siamense]|uniref:Vegetative incompatibility protein HET-E-1 n=1 Tax=Colletotrichum siamense TaxID=690259 RepID=A0A9P5F1F5_COLSI|nr:Vegetative incompatibility protein HET-E-1 [Colletotrichum siamense]KAF4863590.1 Vegetative incompatibility protein HET-E-1 [Colletotrichum siamense]